MTEYGLTGTARVRARAGYEVPYHIARERDLTELAMRNRMFVRGLCGAVIIGFYQNSGRPCAPICERCEGAARKGRV